MYQLNLGEFYNKFPDETSCENFLSKIKFASGKKCPYCDNSRHYWLENQKRFKCSSCRKQFTVKTGTFFSDKKISLHKWFLLIWILTKVEEEITISELAEILELSNKTISSMVKNLKKFLLDQSIINSQTITAS